MPVDAGRVLAIMAHPDDAEFLCAGTLALLVERGWHATIVTATPGDCGSMTVPPDQIASQRRAEAARAASLIQAEYLCLEERDLSIDYNAATRRRVTDAIRRARPDIVFTHPLADYMADHEIIGRLVRDACFAAPMVNYRGFAESAAIPGIPNLYYCDPFDPEMVPPQSGPGVTIDVTTTMGVKRRMLAEHSSQRDWLLAQHGVDEYLRLQDEKARACGERAGFVFGERFFQHTIHPYPTDDLLFTAISGRAGAT